MNLEAKAETVTRGMSGIGMAVVLEFARHDVNVVVDYVAQQLIKQGSPGL